MAPSDSVPGPSTRANSGRGSGNRRRNRPSKRNPDHAKEEPEPKSHALNEIPPTPGGYPDPLLLPASLVPTSAPLSSHTTTPRTSPNEDNNQSSRGRGVRDKRPSGPGRGSGRNPGPQAPGMRVSGAARGHGTRIVGSRRFGGQLTMTDEHSREPGVPSVQADAPDFVPGRQYVPRSAHLAPSNTAQAAKRGSTANGKRKSSVAKSAAPDLPSRIHEDVSNGVYECAICTINLHRKSAIWSCTTCWTVFHLHCIKTWAKNSRATSHRPQAEDSTEDVLVQWRCPGCNLHKSEEPNSYTCWCGKEMSPRADTGLPPHSCGQTCGKRRTIPPSCPHPCDLVCHAGPCRPCSHMGPTQSCFCGKHETTRKCADTDYNVGSWSCEEPCGDVMPCGEHTCPLRCHEGLCGACEQKVEARCYCGKVQTTMLCSSKEEEIKSQLEMTEIDGATAVIAWTGAFDCHQTCARPLDCGKHVCQKGCHSQDAEDTHCPRSPDVVVTCPCGKTPLHELSDVPRLSCQDPVPNCDKACSKLLACKHLCEQNCHTGECSPCVKTVSINCRCGRNSFSTICHQGIEETPQCLRICRATLNCGRHDCGERCCTGERHFVERQALKRRLKPLNARASGLNEDIEPEHICTRVCGRPLKCGNHSCPELCHRGPCGSCREATFEDMYCSCGRTCLEAPVPCGSKVPACTYDCTRSKTCGHPQVPHNCHDDTVRCPKCPFLVDKECMCGKRTLKNQPCWHTDASCGSICGKRLKCGSHYCQKQCHRPGQCEDATAPCHQPCGKPKRSCGHPCEEPCHAPYPCQESAPCPFKLLITCDCQHLKAEVKCNACKASEGNSKKTLKCDEECARLERNRMLALALNIDPATHQDGNIPYQTETLSQYQADPAWAQPQEAALRLFAADPKQKRLNFKPMKPHQRSFIHALAEDFGFDSESMDPEPYRHVAVFKTPKFVAAPMKTLVQCVRIRASLQAEASHKASETRKQVANAKMAPLNGFYIHGARFGLTEEDLRAAFTTCFRDQALTVQVSFLPHDEIALRTSHLRLNGKDLEAYLKTVRPRLADVISGNLLAERVELCVFDLQGTNPGPPLRKELDALGSGSGWNQVAARVSATPRTVTPQEAVGKKPIYTVLGSKLAEAKKKRLEEEALEKKLNEANVVEDWEQEAEKEEREQGSWTEE